MSEYFSAAEWKLVATHGLRIAIILLLAWVLQAVASRLIGVFRTYMAGRSTSDDQQRRVATLERVFRYVATVVILIVAGTLVLGELGVSVAPILATAGVAGVAIGFGAQSLIRDYFTGFFLLLEDQVRQGDVVQIGEFGGVVETVTLRYLRLRDFNGHVLFIPNGEIKVVVNRTRDFAQAVIEVGVAYREDVDEALGVMREVAAAMREDPAWSGRLPEPFEVVGVEALANSSVTLRGRFRVVPPIEQWNVRREFLRRLKAAYDARDIEIPYPHLTVYPGRAKSEPANEPAVSRS